MQSGRKRSRPDPGPGPRSSAGRPGSAVGPPSGTRRPHRGPAGRGVAEARGLRDARFSRAL